MISCLTFSITCKSFGQIFFHENAYLIQPSIWLFKNLIWISKFKSDSVKTSWKIKVLKYYIHIYTSNYEFQDLFSSSLSVILEQSQFTYAYWLERLEFLNHKNMIFKTWKFKLSTQFGPSKFEWFQLQVRITWISTLQIQNAIDL